MSEKNENNFNIKERPAETAYEKPVTHTAADPDMERFRSEYFLHAADELSALREGAKRGSQTACFMLGERYMEACSKEIEAINTKKEEYKKKIYDDPDNAEEIARSFDYCMPDQKGFENENYDSMRKHAVKWLGRAERGSCRAMASAARLYRGLMMYFSYRLKNQKRACRLMKRAMKNPQLTDPNIRPMMEFYSASVITYAKLLGKGVGCPPNPGKALGILQELAKTEDVYQNTSLQIEFKEEIPKHRAAHIGMIFLWLLCLAGLIAGTHYARAAAGLDTSPAELRQAFFSVLPFGMGTEVGIYLIGILTARDKQKWDVDLQQEVKPRNGPYVFDFFNFSVSAALGMLAGAIIPYLETEKLISSANPALIMLKTALSAAVIFVVIYRLLVEISRLAGGR